MQLRPSEDTAFYSCAAAPPLPKRGILIHLAYPCATEEARGTHGRPVLQAMGNYGWSVAYGMPNLTAGQHAALDCLHSDEALAGMPHTDAQCGESI